MRTYGKLDFDSEKSQWHLTEVEPHVIIRLKNIFPRMPKWVSTSFTLPDNLDMATDLYWLMLRYPFRMDKKTKRYLNKQNKAYEKLQKDCEAIQMPDYVPSQPPGLREGCAGRKHQLKNVELLKLVGSLLVTDDIGLGKTYTALLAALQPGMLPMAIVVQTHLPDQWIERTESFTNLTVHRIKKTTPYDLPKADVYIFKYSQLAGWAPIFATGYFKSVTYDEIQELRRGTESAKGNGAAILSQNAQYRLGLTASPIYNYGIEIFNIIDNFLRPGLLGTEPEFQREWCSGDRGIVKDPDALGAYLIECKMIAHTSKRDADSEYKEPVHVVETIEYDHQAILDSQELAKKLALRAMTGTFVERGNSTRELDMYMRQQTGIAKARYVAAFVRMLVESGEKVLLAGWHREVYNIWQKELSGINVAMYTGTESGTRKEKSKHDFVHGDAQVLIISLRSGAGLDDLQHVCSTVVIGELDWSPEVHRQLVGRVDREGQKDPVMAFFPVIEWGSDPVMVDINGLKKSQARGITNPHAGPVMKNNDFSKARLLATQILGEKKVHAIEKEQERKEMAS